MLTDKLLNRMQGLEERERELLENNDPVEVNENWNYVMGYLEALEHVRRIIEKLRKEEGEA